MGMRLQTPANWVGSTAAAAASSSPGSQAAPPQSRKPESIEQMKDMAFQAKKFGFVIGAFMQHKKAAQPEMWKIAVAQANMASIERMENGHVVEKKEVGWTEVVDHWKLFKGKVTIVVDTSIGNPIGSSA